MTLSVTGRTGPLPPRDPPWGHPLLRGSERVGLSARVPGPCPGSPSGQPLLRKGVRVGSGLGKRSIVWVPIFGHLRAPREEVVDTIRTLSLLKTGRSRGPWVLSLMTYPTLSGLQEVSQETGLSPSPRRVGLPWFTTRWVGSSLVGVVGSSPFPRSLCGPRVVRCLIRSTTRTRSLVVPLKWVARPVVKRTSRGAFQCRFLVSHTRGFSLFVRKKGVEPGTVRVTTGEDQTLTPE